MATALACAAAKLAWALQQIRSVLLRLLDGGGALLGEPLIAIVFLLREGQRGLRLRGLLVGLVDLGLLRDDLGLEIGDAGLLLIARGDVVAIVEADQFGAGLDQLIVGHRHVDDGRGDLGADLHRAGVDKGVVGRTRNFWRAATTTESQQQHDGGADGDGGRQTRDAYAQGVAPRRFVCVVAAAGFDRSAGFGSARESGRALVVDALIHDRRLNV